MNLFRSILRFLREEPEDKPLDTVIATAAREPLSFLEHLEALRRHLLRILLALVLCVVVMFPYASRLLALLARPLGGLERLQAIEVTEPIGVFMRVVILGALALAFPYIAFELWLFLAPGLRPAERLWSLLLIPLAVVFFLGGMAFAYFVMLPVALPVLLNFMGIATIPRPLSYLNFVTNLLLWTGICFEYPLVAAALTLAGLVKPGTFLQQWRWMLLIVAVMAAAVTPTGDPINMIIAMAPMIVLYFAGVVLSYLVVFFRRRKPETRSSA